MKIKHDSEFSLTIRRFDTGENITISPGEICDLDEATAEYLKKYKGSFGNSNAVISGFKEAK